jgi:hypothetical protein
LNEQKNWLNRIPANFTGSPKPRKEGEIGPTLMVSPRKEATVNIGITPKYSNPPQTQDKKYSIVSQPIEVRVAENSIKSKETNDTGKMLYMGNYKKGQLGFLRSNSNDPNSTLKLKSSGLGLKDKMGSPVKKTFPTALNIGTPSSARIGSTYTDLRKPDVLSQNIITSPTGQSSVKKKGFGFLGLKFLTKSKV